MIVERAAEVRLRRADIAGALGVSESWLAHQLRRETGASFPAHLRRARLARAGVLLRETAWPVKTVALAVGYERASDFDRDFRRETSASPDAWRRATIMRPTRAGLSRLTGGSR
jgi:AraC family transcriptional regulator